MRKTYKIEIEAEYGSAWQEDIQTKLLALSLEAWKMYALSKHKKNKIKIQTI